jgi:hypothetical protein
MLFDTRAPRSQMSYPLQRCNFQFEIDTASLFVPGSISLGEQVQCPDVYARVYLARLSSLLLFAPSLARPDLQAQFGALLFKLILDPSTKVSLYESTLALYSHHRLISVRAY